MSNLNPTPEELEQHRLEVLRKIKAPKEIAAHEVLLDALLSKIPHPPKPLETLCECEGCREVRKEVGAWYVKMQDLCRKYNYGAYG